MCVKVNKNKTTLSSPCGVLKLRRKWRSKFYALLYVQQMPKAAIGSRANGQAQVLRIFDNGNNMTSKSPFGSRLGLEAERPCPP
jgi:hypothetical protein